MNNFKVRNSNTILTEREVRDRAGRAILPSKTHLWNKKNVYDQQGIDPILKSLKPAPSTDLRVVIRDGAGEDSLGNIVEKWIEINKFSDFTVDGVFHSRIEQEEEHIVELDEAAIQQEIDQALTDFEAEIDLLTEGFSSREIALWRVQEREAVAHSLDQTSPTPFIDEVVRITGETKAEFIAIVLMKVDALTVASGKALGRKRKKERDAEKSD